MVFFSKYLYSLLTYNVERNEKNQKVEKKNLYNWVLLGTSIYEYY